MLASFKRVASIAAEKLRSAPKIIVTPGRKGMGFPRARDHARMRTRARFAGFCAIFTFGIAKSVASRASAGDPAEVDMRWHLFA
ncbi:hypothetical protein PFL603g_03503 [Pseudomonas fluorescens]|uniref:Uncharacterized protein n=1 Tax=Pseudomonas fluorescens TaxID=294 RepID=A0A120FYN7_PSEFL|nr:hypothetical protein PFL603g_03503 [Pseudomonas fluorescens]